MKQRFSSLDVKVVAHELAEALVSLRLSNIYDLNSKILLLKFAKPNNRQQILIESGFRCHLTDFARAAAPAPSPFVSRLRKFLKTRRVTNVSQIGTDRIIEIQFSDGAYRLYLEFFAGGNVILTDATLKILALLRVVPEGKGQEPQRVGLDYSLKDRQNVGGVPALTKERLQNALMTASAQATGSKSKKKGTDELRRGIVTTLTELPPILVDHVFHTTKFDSTTKLAEVLRDQSLLDALFQSLEQARSILNEVTSSPTVKGYIIAKPNPRAADLPAGGDETGQDLKPRKLLYEDFQPFLPKQFEDDSSYQVLSFEGYNRTVDEFFSSLEGQKLESRLQEREMTAKRKLEAARRDQAQRIEGLQGAQTLNLRKAAAIEANIERVQEAMDAVNGLLEQGMDWMDVNKLVEREQRQHNPVAEIIKLPLRLHESVITLLLGEAEDEVEADEEQDFDYDTDEEAVDDDGAEKPKGPENRLAIDINLKLTPWNNAREYYEQKRTAADKEQKTVQQSEIALRNAEQKITEDLKKGLKQEKPVLQPIRKQMWFEKFIWFVSSDGYLVLGGRDAQQNEILYKRYLKKGDVYVHADMHGAPSVIIKNNPKTPDAPIPPSTLAQAGNLAVCCSNAWDSKAAMGAYWVNADQVSKSAPTGEFLPVGSFMVRGKRNVLPPALLTLGFGLMFKVSEESQVKHAKHRLYDVGDITAPVAASASGSLEAETDEPPSKENALSESEGEESEDESEKSNPLQSGTADDDESVQGQDSEPPAEALADLQVVEKDDHVGQGPHPDAQGEAEPEEEAGEDAGEEEQEDEEEQSISTRPDTPSTSTTSQSQKKHHPAKRGQRGKAKKIAAKYRHQDDEDRALMEELLGVAAGRQKAEAEAAAKAQREAEAAAARARREKAQERARKQVAEHEQARQRLLFDKYGDGEDDITALADAAAELGPLGALVGTPLPGDEILEVIPVCAPWGALGRIKYKAKIQPGHIKKGKAVKEIVERWKLASGKKGVVDEKSEDGEKMWPREVALIKGLKVEESFNVVPVGKVTVMMSGGLAGSGSGGGGGKGGAKGGGAAGGGQKGGKGKGGKKR
ncbi:fibronectin-binding protein A N-terminus-domain-containing protein [Dichotomopilus funicola]|uniref:Ribosome quality control complex subunit 2 n=1 Tax=Dichotomopilus funicola TaxID=1934379 RepID=A0AAN6V7G2_9PEZI|nr:fibronectin-binding protein A N-terminus-domain-containing protein [Dichotomopilus funicola]